MDFKFVPTLLLLLVHCAHCLPQREDFIIPNPAEINNFYQDPIDLNEHREVAPLNQFNPTATLEETVKEVEELIKANPKLPRLTRGEIIDILENITSADILQAQNFNRADGQRAIMVVMPFTAGSAQGDIKELYTRAPVTHIIGGDIPKVEFKPKKKPIRRKPPSFPIIQIDENDAESNLIQEKGSNINTFNTPSTTTENTPTTAVTTTQKILTSSLSPPTKPVATNTYDFTTHETLFQILPEAAGLHLNPPQKYANHKYPDEDPTTFAPVNGIHVISPPTFINFDDEYSKPYTVKLQDLKRVSNPPEILPQKPIQTTSRSVIDDIIVPEDFKLVAEDLEVLHKPNFNKINMVLPKQTTETVFLPIPVVTTSSTTRKPIPGVSEVVDHLSPDMKDLLQNFGLLENPNEKPEEVQLPISSDGFAKNAEIKPESYMGFKPLPDDTPSRQEMDEFLARFGLGKNSERSQKSIAVNKSIKELEKTPHINLDVVPPSYHGVMQDLGFTTRNVKTMRSHNQITSSPKHVFNPTTQNNTEEEMGRLTKLLNIIKDLDKKNSNLTEESLKNIDVNVLKDLIDNFNAEAFVPLDEKSGPNPLNYGYKIIKNEFKRQENTTTTSTTTTSTTETTKSPSFEFLEASTEAARGPSFEDLEASFGGLPETKTTTTEAPSTTRRSGFYYLVDWNTFLDVDDQNGRRVNLRFQPKVGDPRNFRYVTVP